MTQGTGKDCPLPIQTSTGIWGSLLEAVLWVSPTLEGQRVANVLGDTLSEGSTQLQHILSTENRCRVKF